MRNLFRILSFLLIPAFILAGTGKSEAQSGRTITGKVFDSKGEPLIGATVMVKGTSTGTIVGENGTYTLRAPKSATIQVSMLGYETAEMPVEERREINFTLMDDSQILQEAVVEVGYGEQRLVDVTGTVSRVNMEEIIKAPVVSIDQALQGRIAGVNLSSPDGQPGSEMSVVIRGANSITQDNSPLYVVDGFAMEDFAGTGLSPQDVASITVLKDASATAIYGSRAANGVIIIETKKGKLGKPSVTYNGQFGLDQSAKRMEMMTPYEFVDYQIERSGVNFDKYLTDVGRTMEDYLNYDAIDWQSKVFRNAFTHTHNLSMMGGTSQTRYSASFNAVNQDGVIANSGYKKYQGRMALEQKVGKNFRVNLNMSYTDAEVSGQASSTALSTSNSYATYLMYRVWSYRPVSLASMDEEDLFDDDPEGTSSSSTMNPVISNANEQTSKKTTTYTVNGKIEWQIVPGLKLNVRGGFSDRIIRAEEFNNSKTYKGFPRITNTLGVNGSFKETKRIDWMNENTLTFDRTFDKKHKVGAMVGNTIQGQKRTVYGFVASYIPNEEMGLSGMDDGVPQSIDAIISDNRLLSFFTRLNYGYDNRYLVTATFRADGSSKFAPGHKWGYFPSAAFAWRFGQESWARSARWLQDGKLRLSYGLTGNNRVGDYASYQTLSLGEYYPFNNTPESAMLLNAMGNTDLTWETTEQIDLGLDLKLWDGRLNLTVDLYSKITRNLLLNANLPYSSGFANVYKNVGKVGNKGIELTINTINVRTRDFMWTSDFNIAFNDDKVLELAEGQESLLSKVGFTGDFNNTNLYIAQVGKPMASFYGMVWDGVYKVEDFDVNAGGAYVLKPEIPTNGDPREQIQPGDIKYVDQNGDGVVNDQDMVVIGRCAPICTGGFNNTFSWRGLSLNVFFQWSCGNQIMNANRIIFEGNYANKNINQFRSYNNHWTFDNQESTNYRVGGQGPRGVYSSRTIEDGSFLRLKTLQLSYTFPKKLSGKLKMDVLQLSLAAQNLWTLTSYSGLDPEVSTRHSALTPGFDYSAYARNRSYTVGINITF